MTETDELTTLRTSLAARDAEIELLRASLKLWRDAYETHRHEPLVIAYEATAALATPPAPSPWRPIESAPKDGTPVLVGWNAGGWEPSKCHCEDGVWGHLTHEMGFLPCDPQPTHWLPLPPPPAMNQEGGV